MKILISVFAFALAAPAAQAALNPVLLQDIAQRMVNGVLQNDDMIQSLRGEFNTSQTNLENNIAAVQTFGKATNLPWAPGVVSEASTTGAYRAVYRAARYGVEASASATVTTPVLALMRYTAKEANKSVIEGPYSAETKAILVQLETVTSLRDAHRLLKELNQVGKRALDDEIQRLRGLVIDEEENGNSSTYPPNPVTLCQRQASQTQDGNLDWYFYDRCVQRQKADLNVVEMAKIVQDTMAIEFNGTAITLMAVDAGGILEAAYEYQREGLTRFENRVAKVVITERTVTTSAQAFVGIRKREFERIEKDFKTALNRYQSQDPQTISNVDRDLRKILSEVKKFIRNQPRR